MRTLDLIKTASANMRRNRARTILTIIAVFIGAFTFTLTNGIGAGIKSYLNDQVGNLGAKDSLVIQAVNPEQSPEDIGKPQKYDPNRKVSNSSGPAMGGQLVMTDKDIEIIKSEPAILDVQPSRNLGPDYIDAGGEKYQISVDESYGSLNLDMSTGRTVNNDSDENEITIPSNYVDVLGFSGHEDAVGKEIILGVTNAEGAQTRLKGTIVGVQRNSIVTSNTAFLNDAFATELYDFQSQGLPEAAKQNYIFLVARFDDSLNEQQITELKDRLREKGYSALTLKDQINTVFSVIDAIIIVFNMFGAIALLSASFGIVNTLLMAVQERTKEIGLMKALGMGKRRIFALFSIEAVLIGFWGSLLGIVFANLIGRLINTVASNSFLKDFEGLELLSFPAPSILLIMLSIMAIAFLAGTLPARNASRKDPIEALRYE